MAVLMNVPIEREYTHIRHQNDDLDQLYVKEPLIYS